MRIFVSFFVLITGIQLGKSLYEHADVTDHANWHLINSKHCGLSDQMRIIGGQKAFLGQFPWLVQLGYSYTGYIAFPFRVEFKCGGSLINPMYVLTAAHCVTSMDYDNKLSTVRLGEYDSHSNPDCEGNFCAPKVQDFSPAELIVHAEYDSPIYHNDIALIRLDRPAILNSNVKPICLPHGPLLNMDFTGETGEVAGWGIFDMRIAKQSSVLLHVRVPFVPLNQCASTFSRLANVYQGQLCAGGNAGHDSCGGDSGGPLMKAANVDGVPKYYVLGLVSFGYKNCGSRFPAVYTDVTHYMTWILDNIRA